MASTLHIHELYVQRGEGSQAYGVYLPELDLREGQIIAVTGESGCGKSTLLECLGLLLAPGRVGAFTLGRTGIDIKALLASGNQSALAAIRARHLGFMLQTGGLLPYLTVQENILLPRKLLGLSGQGACYAPTLSALDLAPLLKKRPSMLSIGERQRVAFARALAHEPQVILADEPTASLDPVRAQKLFELFTHLVEKTGISAVVVSHDWELVQRFGLECMHAQVNPNETCFTLRTTLDLS